MRRAQIVVDDASTDATPEIARNHGANVLQVDLHRISAVRNAGARVAKGELLVFVDADTLVPADTLAQMLAAVRGGAIGGGARVRLDERYFASEEIHFARALRKRGRFAMLPAAVVSSGRKLRLFRGWQLLRQMLRVALGGLAGLRRREGLEFWYDGRREATDLRSLRGRGTALRQSSDA